MKEFYIDLVDKRHLVIRVLKPSNEPMDGSPMEARNLHFKNNMTAARELASFIRHERTIEDSRITKLATGVYHIQRGH